MLGKRLEDPQASILGVNGPAFAPTLFAAARAGVALVPLNYRLGDQQLAQLVANHPGAFFVRFLFIAGRADDTIIRGGENIAPTEIEDVLLRHPDVADAVVIRVPDQEWGQRIEAAVVLRDADRRTGPASPPRPLQPPRLEDARPHRGLGGAAPDRGRQDRA